MLDDFKKELTSFRLLAVLLTVAVSIYLLQFFWQAIMNFSDVIWIVVFGWLLSFMLEPIVHLVSRFTRLSKTYSALLVYAFFAVLFSVIIFLFIPLVSFQFQAVSRILPVFLDTAPKFVQNWVDSITASLINIFSYAPSVASFLVSLLVALILSFYLIVDKERINEEMYKLTPKKWHENMRFIQQVIDDTFASFLRIQVIFGVVAGIITWIVLRIFNIDFAASTALVAGILTVIPLIGPVLAVIPPTVITLIFNPTNPTMAVIILAILILLQQLAYNIIGPKLMGKAFRLHPIVVLLSFLIGYKVAGPIGSIFAVPVLGIIGVIIRELGHHFISGLQKQ